MPHRDRILGLYEPFQGCAPSRSREHHISVEYARFAAGSQLTGQLPSPHRIPGHNTDHGCAHELRKVDYVWQRPDTTAQYDRASIGCLASIPARSKTRQHPLLKIVRPATPFDQLLLAPATEGHLP